jgi:hypothetical protein
MLVSIIILAFVTAIASSAQSRGQGIRADIPFDFVVGEKTLAAGEYSINQATTSSDGGILVRNLKSNHVAVRLTTAVVSRTPRQKTFLTFLRYGNTYFLSQLWVSGSGEGRQVLKSRAERLADRELARNSSAGNLAQNSKPEVVTIIATFK